MAQFCTHGWNELLICMHTIPGNKFSFLSFITQQLINHPTKPAFTFSTSLQTNIYQFSSQRFIVFQLWNIFVNLCLFIICEFHFVFVYNAYDCRVALRKEYLDWRVYRNIGEWHIIRNWFISGCDGFACILRGWITTHRICLAYVHHRLCSLNRYTKHEWCVTLLPLMPILSS